MHRVFFYLKVMGEKTVFITGATSGIGAACARSFAKQGHKLVICGRRKEVLEQLKQELSSQTEVYSLIFDVRNHDEVKQAITSLPKSFSEVDILINNAGNAHGLEPIHQGNIEDWDAMMDGNVKGLLYVSKYIIPIMIERQTGHIINLSSVAARQTYANGVVYCASKKAVDAISEGMRLELTEHGIKVTNIQPGAVETEFSKVRFKGDDVKSDAVYAGFNALQAQDIADAVVYCINAPKHVSIADMTIYPQAQAEARTIHRNKNL